MTDVQLIPLNQVHFRIKAEPAILREMSDHFSFMVPGYRFMPRYKAKIWDGKIRILKNDKLYVGLADDVEQFCRDRDYQFESRLEGAEEFSLVEAEDFIETLPPLPEHITPREDQLKLFTHAVRDGRNITISPTGSGKSLMIYWLSSYYSEGGGQAVIVVPTISLVMQMKNDLISYGAKPEDVDIIYHSGEYTGARYVISTGKSLAGEDAKFLNQFQVMIADEVHLFAAQTMTQMTEKMTEIPHKFGFTGTLDDSQTNQTVLRGLFGRIRQEKSTKQLIDEGALSPLKIKCMVLQWNKADRAECSKKTFAEEIDWLIGNDRRNRVIANLVKSLKGNTLVLVNHVDKHGIPLYNLLVKHCPNKKIYYVDRNVKPEERERIRQLVETEEDAVIVATSKLFSTGINIRRLHNIVSAVNTKTRIRILQSIGRGLRKSADKLHCTWFDIVDDLQHNKKKNYGLQHFYQRIKLYSKEQFKYKIYPIKVKE